jgi:hypothetical protein
MGEHWACAMTATTATPRTRIAVHVNRGFGGMALGVSIDPATNAIVFVEDPMETPWERAIRWAFCVQLAARVRYTWPPARGMEA